MMDDVTPPLKTRLMLPPGGDPNRGPGWTDLWIRAGTSDEDVLHEIWIDDVYHLRGLDLLGEATGAAGGTHTENPRIIDVGACTGIFTALCLQLFPDSTVVAIEPDTRNVELLNLNTMSWRHRCDIVRAAIGSSTGQVNLVGSHATGHTEPHRSDDSRPVALLPLVQFLDRPVALLKLDCEGAEYDTIAACPSDALANAARIYMEWHGTREAPWIDDPPRRFGEMLARLSFTHTIQTFGRPDEGGYLFATRY